MHHRLNFKSKHMLFAALFLMIAVSLFGCSGDKGDTGATGPQGPAGPRGADLTAGTVDAGTFSFEDLKNIPLGGKIISASTAGDKPTVTFQVVNKNTNEGIRGLRTFSLHVAQLKPEANGSNSYWQNYILTANATPRPTTDPVSTFNTDGTVKTQGYSVVDNGDGTYVATFGTNIKTIATVPYDATLVHRIVVGVRSVAVPGVVGLTPGAYAGPMNPLTGAVFAQFTNTNGVNLTYDFIPSTGAMVADSTGKQAFARDIVTIDACNQCHYKLQYGSNNTSGHFGSRTDTKTCVMCHTPQNIVAGKEATTNADFTPFIHKIHMGDKLPIAETSDLVTFEATYPQDQRNCTMCHKGTDKDNWKTKPTIKACGSCHNNVNFATGAGHVGGAKSDNTSCTLCHAAADIQSYHVAVLPPDPNSPEMGGTNTHTFAGYLPAAGAKPAGAAAINWVIRSVSVNASNRPTMDFKVTKDGADVVFNTFAAGKELMDNFVGSPSIYFAFSVPQDNSTAPADYNATASTWLRNVWSGAASGASAATLSGPDATGYYTITLTGVTIPANAKMLTGGVGYTYGVSTPPLTQTNVAGYPYNAATKVGGLITVVPNAWKVATGFTGRRLIVSNDKCNACHVQLGVEPTFHAGNRNDSQTCTFCHNVNRVNSGWGVNIKEAVHSIHGAGKRVNKFSWEATAGATYWDVTYPGILKNCEQCHIAGMYDFSATNAQSGTGLTGSSAYYSATVMGNLLYTTVATGATSATGVVIKTGSETFTDSVISPFVTPGTDYGTGFSFTPATGVTKAAAPTTLVSSPISSACYSCHDSAIAKGHMVANGGSIYEARATALAKSELCLVCHGVANNAAFNETVPTIKAVHRWW